MFAGKLLITAMIILLTLNFFYLSMTPNAVTFVALGTLTGFIVSMLATGIISGIQIVGTGLNTASIKIIFGVATILNILFRIEIAGVPIGMGLLTNVYNIFANTDFFGFGMFLVTTLGLVIFISAFIIITGGA